MRSPQFASMNLPASVLLKNWLHRLSGLLSEPTGEANPWGRAIRGDEDGKLGHLFEEGAGAQFHEPDATPLFAGPELRSGPADMI